MKLGDEKCQCGLVEFNIGAGGRPHDKYFIE